MKAISPKLLRSFQQVRGIIRSRKPRDPAFPGPVRCWHGRIESNP
jgi:hypothetical protein